MSTHEEYDEQTNSAFAQLLSAAIKENPKILLQAIEDNPNLVNELGIGNSAEPAEPESYEIGEHAPDKNYMRQASVLVQLNPDGLISLMELHDQNHAEKDIVRTLVGEYNGENEEGKAQFKKLLPIKDRNGFDLEHDKVAVTKVELSNVLNTYDCGWNIQLPLEGVTSDVLTPGQKSATFAIHAHQKDQNSNKRTVLTGHNALRDENSYKYNDLQEADLKAEIEALDSDDEGRVFVNRYDDEGKESALFRTLVDEEEDFEEMIELEEGERLFHIDPIDDDNEQMSTNKHILGKVVQYMSTNLLNNNPYVSSNSMDIKFSRENYVELKSQHMLCADNYNNGKKLAEQQNDELRNPRMCQFVLHFTYAPDEAAEAIADEMNKYDVRM